MFTIRNDKGKPVLAGLKRRMETFINTNLFALRWEAVS